MGGNNTLDFEPIEGNQGQRQGMLIIHLGGGVRVNDHS
jgi:hypothetical protein